MKTTLIAVVVPVLLAGCTSTSPLPNVVSYKSPVSAAAKVPTTHYHTTLTGYTHREPTAPDAWVTEDAPAKEECEKPGGDKNACKPQ